MTGISERIARATAGLGDPHAISAALKAEFPENDRPAVVVALGLAMDYFPSGPNEIERREQWGVFTPMIETTAGVYPPPLNEIDAEVRGHWVKLAEESLPAVVSARICDLLWELRDGPRPDLWARRAANDYLALASLAEPVSMNREECLVRTSEIARALKDRALQRQGVLRNGTR